MTETPTTTPQPRKHTKKKIAAVLLAFLLFVAGYLYFTQPATTPAPVPAENAAQAEWFAALAELQALPAPTLVCSVDGDEALRTFVFPEQVDIASMGTATYEDCAILVNGGYTLNENGDYVEDAAKVEAALNALGYTGSWTATSTLPPAPNGTTVTMDETAADTFRTELGELAYFAGESSTDADGTVNVIAPETLSAPFQTTDGMTANERAEVRNKVSDADYKLLTKYANEVLSSARTS